MRKIKLVNKERFQTFLSVVGLTVVVIMLIAIPKRTSPIESWHKAIDEGKSWNEYIREEC